MWEAINSKKDGKLISLDMIFVDEKSDLVHAIVKKNPVNRFKNKLSEGSLFVIKNFKVVETSDAYRSVENPLKIIFFPSTVIKNLTKDIVDIPVNGFHFIKAKLIESRVNNKTILSGNVCSKKIEPANGVYRCPNCKKDCKFPLVKYKDLGRTFNKLSSNNNDVPVQIERLCRKDFVFNIKFNTYSLKEGFENFTVSKVWILDDKLELEYMQREEKKVKNLPEDESIPKPHGTKELSKEKNLEDPEEVHVIDGAKSRKRRNLIIDEDEISDEDTNKCKKDFSIGKNSVTFESLFKLSWKTFKYICSLVKEELMVKPTNITDLSGKFLSLDDRVVVALRRLDLGNSLSTVDESLGDL
ncbi:hypothetical protein HAX54_002555 [Datura stramonium]|uniref:Replication protein A 70 kDa DNA-binding subunit B/D first OB fold domain-containing protein n=1 Tax=Datura stramonium TaxID=4076 RepID=A0ABS8WV87_DATST|nr:hypothetical protein [Datura stramonium]